MDLEHLVVAVVAGLLVVLELLEAEEHLVVGEPLQDALRVVLEHLVVGVEMDNLEHLVVEVDLVNLDNLEPLEMLVDLDNLVNLDNLVDLVEIGVNPRSVVLLVDRVDALLMVTSIKSFLMVEILK